MTSLYVWEQHGPDTNTTQDPCQCAQIAPKRELRRAEVLPEVARSPAKVPTLECQIDEVDINGAVCAVSLEQISDIQDQAKPGSPSKRKTKAGREHFE